MARKVRINVDTRIAGAKVKAGDEVLIDDSHYHTLSAMRRNTAAGTVAYVTAIDDAPLVAEPQVKDERPTTEEKATKKKTSVRKKAKKETATNGG